MSALLMVALWCAATPPPQPAEGVVPAGTVVGLVSPLTGEAPYAFDVAPDGQPVLARGDTFVPVKDRPERSLPTFSVAGVDAGAIAFTADGALLVVSGRVLGVVSARGFQKLADLPADGLRLAAAGPKEVLLFGGGHLYRFSAGGRVEHLLESPVPIDAVAADGARTLLATGNAVVALEAGGLSVVVELPSRAVSLALAPRGGFFVSTGSGVDWVSRGRRYPFLKGRGGQVRVTGNELFVLFPREGLYKVAPLDGFAAYGARVDALLDGGVP